MIDDLESNMQTNNNESNSDKFPMSKCELPGSQQSVNILSMSSSKKYLYLVTENSEILCIESKSLNPLQQSFSISPSSNSKTVPFKENLTKIWTDREGNHSIIRYNNRIYYFNILLNQVKELESFKNIEICAVGFNDKNLDANSTGLFLAADYNNNIYECEINIEKKVDEKKKSEETILSDNKKLLTTLVFKDWDTEEDEEYSEPKTVNYEHIYGIRFVKTTKLSNEIGPNDNVYYIMFVTKTKIYQFRGPGEKTFQQCFEKFNKNDMLFNDYCKYFPHIPKISKVFTGTDIDFVYRAERLEQFGWKTECGYCFGTFNIEYLPHEVKNFTVIPFEKINSQGKKESRVEPLSVTQTINHIFVLYSDSLTIISKLTSNIILTQFLEHDFTGVIYNEFAENNGLILLYSRNGLYQIPLKDENKDIWKDYLDTGDYTSALKCVDDDKKLNRRINRISAEEDFYAKDYLNSVMKYNFSDEKFEVVCLRYLMKNQIDALKLYCELYLSQNVNLEEKNNIEANAIATMIIELLINTTKEEKKSLDTFRTLVRENLKFFRSGNIIYDLVKSYGRMGEFIEYASIMGDYETVVMYYINSGNISEALDKLIEFASYLYDDDKINLKRLTDLFLNNSHAFFKNNPKESIDLIKQKFKDISMETVIQAIICTMDKEDYNLNSKISVPKKEENSLAIIKYLKYLIEKKNASEESNIHNLYIYYLLKSRKNQNVILDYLKSPLKYEEPQFITKKKKALFQLDFAKKLFVNNVPAYALVLAHMGKYSDAVRKALSVKDIDCRKIAEFIASNAPTDSLKKQLWIEIFSCDNSQNEFEEALKIMKNSKILKIEDVLPHITDTIKIEDFKKQISECIADYENNISKLKEDINSYNKTAENIKNDIANLKKRSMEIPYSNYKCVICQNYIKNKNIYLFPCGHMFDANCIRECLLNYEATGLEYVHEKNMKIDKLFLELGYIKKSSYEDTKIKKIHSSIPEQEKTTPELTQTQAMPSNMAAKVADNIKNNLLDKFSIFKKIESNIEEKVVKRIGTINLSNIINNNNNNKDNKLFEAELNEILSEQCVLCGDYMVDSIQCSVCKPKRFIANSDGYKMHLETSSDWDYIC